MANGINSAIDRRLRGLLPAEDLVAMNAPFASTTGPFLSPGDPGFATAPSAQGPPMLGPSGGPFQDIPEGLDSATQAIMAQAAGRQAGMDAVARRQAALSAVGGGTFLGPSTGLPAQFGGGRFSRTPALFMAGGNDMNDRIREIGEAVKRRLEELTGAPPNQPQFASPQPGSAITRRGRFGT